MDIYRLRSFAVLAEHLHFGSAARALHISQPALTKQIRRLEEEAGIPLFERAPATRLSAAGAQWLPEVKALLTHFDATSDFIHKAAGGETGLLRVGFGFHTLELVPAMVAKLRASSPGLQISLRDMSTAEQSASLAAGQLDIGFMRMPIADAKNYEIRPVIKDRLALVTPESRASGPKLRLGDFRAAAFVSISRSRSPGFFNHFLSLCAAHGFHPRVVQEVYEFPTAIALVRAGMGVTMIPQSLWTGRLSGVAFHRIEDRRAQWKVSAVWRRGDTNPALAAFLRWLPKTAPAIA